MKKDFLNQLLQNRIALLDGGYGTELTKMGMPDSVCPEQWVTEHPEKLIRLYKEYMSAGADVLYTFTLGANRSKLSNYQLSSQAGELNRNLASLAKEAASGKAFVAGDIGPTGKGIKPLGSLSFEETVDIYKEQVQALLEGGVDLFVIETMIDIQEARAAAIAVKETCDLPFIVTFTFEKNGRTVGGTSPSSAMITMQSLGASAVGANCGHGPDSMSEMIREMSSVATVPVIAKPNAGVPMLIQGRTVFNMEHQDFVSHCEKLLEDGASVIGGCCGTNSNMIRGLYDLTKEKCVVKKDLKRGFLSSGIDSLTFDLSDTGLVIGERINPTGKKSLQQELSKGQYETVLELARIQKEAGAFLLDVNVAVPGIDEATVMTEVVERLSWSVSTPLCLDSADPNVFEKALRVYPGRALVNSVSMEREKIEKLFPIIKKYGCMVILLPLSGSKLPKDNEEKHAIIRELVNKAKTYGFTEQDFIVDALTMSIASVPSAGKELLETVEYCKRNGWFTISGLSNISFGMPERKTLNATLMTLCIQRGLNFAISDPSNDLVMNAVVATKLLMNDDPNGATYINHVRPIEGVAVTEKIPSRKEKISQENDDVYNGVLKGRFDSIVSEVQRCLQKGVSAESMIQERLIPAIQQVGVLYEKNIYYLPQLIASSNAMKKAVEYLEPLLKKESKAALKKVCVMATVKGDIHDIGKNIVSLVLSNNGFEIVDLGKDVDANTIIEAAVKHQASLIGLSALMTVTMRHMKDVIDLKNQKCPHVKVMIGGACVTSEYAMKIGADGYAENANEAVRVAKTLLLD